MTPANHIWEAFIKPVIGDLGITRYVCGRNPRCPLLVQVLATFTTSLELNSTPAMIDYFAKMTKFNIGPVESSFSFRGTDESYEYNRFTKESSLEDVVYWPPTISDSTTLIGRPSGSDSESDSETVPIICTSTSPDENLILRPVAASTAKGASKSSSMDSAVRKPRHPSHPDYFPAPNAESNLVLVPSSSTSTATATPPKGNGEQAAGAVPVVKKEHVPYQPTGILVSSKSHSSGKSIFPFLFHTSDKVCHLNGNPTLNTISEQYNGQPVLVIDDIMPPTRRYINTVLRTLLTPEERCPEIRRDKQLRLQYVYLIVYDEGDPEKTWFKGQDGVQGRRPGVELFSRVSMMVEASIVDKKYVYTVDKRHDRWLETLPSKPFMSPIFGTNPTCFTIPHLNVYDVKLLREKVYTHYQEASQVRAAASSLARLPAFPSRPVTAKPTPTATRATSRPTLAAPSFSSTTRIPPDVRSADCISFQAARAEEAKRKAEEAAVAPGSKRPLLVAPCSGPPTDASVSEIIIDDDTDVLKEKPMARIKNLLQGCAPSANLLSLMLVACVDEFIPKERWSVVGDKLECILLRNTVFK
jgi:hypothetical protein